MRNRLKYVIIILSVTVLLLSILLFIRELKCYKKTMSFRLDPLEETKLDTNLQLSEDRLWVLGDSRAYGWDSKYLSFYPLSINNFGIGGQTTIQVLERFQNDITAFVPQVVLIQVGINDLKCIGFLKEDNITQNCIDNTIELLEFCKKNQINAIYSSIFPLGKMELFRKPLWKVSIIDSIEKVNNTLEDYCRLNDFIYFNSYDLLTISEVSHNTKFQYYQDFFHLNESGYKYLSEELKKQLNLNTLY